MHLSDICLLQNKSLKPSKYRNAVSESLASFKNDKNILMLLIYQSRYGKRENRMRSKYSESTQMRF